MPTTDGYRERRVRQALWYLSLTGGVLDGGDRWPTWTDSEQRRRWRPLVGDLGKPEDPHVVAHRMTRMEGEET